MSFLRQSPLLLLLLLVYIVTTKTHATDTLDLDRALGNYSTPATNTTANDTEPESPAILRDNNSTIQSVLLHLYRRKTHMSLGFLNKVAPVVGSIQHNMTSLLEKSADDSFHSLDSYKEADDSLATKLQEVEQKLADNRLLLERYARAYKETEQKLNIVHDTLARIVLPPRIVNTTAVPITTTIVESSTSLPTLTPPVPTEYQYAYPQGCGGTYQTDSGVIAYKVGQPLIPFEGCVWIIQARNSSANQIKFQLTNPEFTTTDTTFLSVGYFVDSNYGVDFSFIWKKIEAGSNAGKIQVAAPVAFVHFVSSPQPGAAIQKGFSLHFQAEYSGIPTNHITFVFTNLFFSGRNDRRKYPLYGQYSNNERVAIVVQPTSLRSLLTINWWDFEGGITYDSLSIWSFGSDYTWRRLTKLHTSRSLSHRREFRFSGPRNDPMLLIFKSDESSTRDGFEFEWSA